MTTNVNTNTGASGATNVPVATENLSGAITQRVKLVLGATDTDDGDVASGNPIPVTAFALPLPTGASTSAKQDTGNTSLGNIDTAIGAKADAAATTDAGTFSLIALIKRMLGKLPSLGQTTMSGSQPVTMASDQPAIPVTVSQTLFSVAASLTRPADTTAYTVGDAVTDSTSAPTTLSLSSVGSGNSSQIEIDSVIVTSSVKGSVLPYFRVYISNNAMTATNDNSAFALSASENNNVCAQIDMGAPYAAVGSTRLERHDLAIVCTTSSTNTLNVLLVIDNAYTPASGEVFRVIIKGRRLG